MNLLSVYFSLINEVLSEAKKITPGGTSLATGELTSAKHSSSISSSPSEGVEPVPKKAQHDIDAKPDDDSATPSPSERSHKTPFGCGCGKCTFFTFIERGCPTPIPSISSFPYLDLNELTHEQQQDLKVRLQFESGKIMMQFQKLVSATIESLNRQNVSRDKLLSYVMTLRTLKPVFEEPQLPALHYRFKELKAAKTIYEFFLVLNDYFSFFNYHMIEHIIEGLGTEEDKAGLQRYKKDFNQYVKRRIFECLPEFGPISDADHADVVVIIDSQYDYTVAEIKLFCLKLSEILDVPQGILRLCRIEKGCFQLMFQVPSSVQQQIFPLSREQEKALADMGVIRLTCGEYQFLVKLSNVFNH